ncbi:MAG TPA: hypothetical protein VD993_08535 [Chitinophagaceae bacterium]|nr:hypothetical protein [Chitinophagaceae bacterium]
MLLTFCLLAQVKPTPADERLRGMQQRKVLEKRSLVNNLAFRNIGPSIMSGRVVDLEVNPDDPTEFYVAYATGGLWHSINNGQSFTSIFDSEDVLVLGDIAVNWGSGPNNRTIWAGTGEVNSSRSSYAGLGMYKSSDNGKTWEYIGLPESHHIGKVQLHPSDPNTAWVAVLGHLYSPNKERGVYKTTDGGKTWKQTLYVDDNTGAVDMDINPQNPNEVYAAMWYRTRTAWNFEEGGKTSGIYKSTDGGNTWTLLTKEGAGFPVGAGVGRIGIAVYPKNPQIVYAVMDNNFRKPDTAQRRRDTSRYVLRDFEKLTKEEFEALDNRKLGDFLRRSGLSQKYTAQVVKEMVRTDRVKPTILFEHLFDANTALFDTPIIGCEIYRSDNGGQTWKKTNQKDLALYNTYGYYFGKIYVSPANDQKLVITGFTIELSTDGGKNWTRMDQGNVHADHHAAWINPRRDSHIFSGNDGGLNITYDDGKNWFKANTPPVAQYYAITVDNASPYNIYGGLQDNGSWWGPANHRESINWVDDGNYAFKSINGGDGMQAQVDTRDNQTVYSGSQFGSYSRYNKMAPRVNPRSVRPTRELGEPQLRFNWQTPIWLSKHHQDVFYYGSNKFHRSLNKGDTMITMSTDLTNGGKPGDVPYGTLTTIVESPIRFGLLYVGTDDGNIHISKDGGYSWAALGKPAGKTNAGLPQGLWVSRVIASQFKESRVYVTLNGYRFDNFTPYLFVSEDYGTTWKQLGKDLPAEPLNVVREDPKSDSILYVGSDGGLYVSIDAGNSFMMWTRGLPKSVPVHDIAIQQRDNEIVLGTHGRSLYIAKLDSVQLLLRDPGYRQKQQSAANATAAASDQSSKEIYRKEEKAVLKTEN